MVYSLQHARVTSHTTRGINTMPHSGIRAVFIGIIYCDYNAPKHQSKSFVCENLFGNLILIVMADNMLSCFFFSFSFCCSSAAIASASRMMKLESNLEPWNPSESSWDLESGKNQSDTKAVCWHTVRIFFQFVISHMLKTAFISLENIKNRGFILLRFCDRNRQSAVRLFSEYLWLCQRFPS